MWQIDWDIPLAEYCRRYTHGRNERERDMTVDMWIASGIGFFIGAMFGILIVALMAACED